MGRGDDGMAAGAGGGPEVEAQIALLAVGVDPDLHFLHTEQLARDSLALEVMVALGPEVDR